MVFNCVRLFFVGLYCGGVELLRGCVVVGFCFCCVGYCAVLVFLGGFDICWVSFLWG